MATQRSYSARLRRSSPKPSRAYYPVCEAMEERCLLSIGHLTDDLAYVRPTDPSVAILPLLTVGESVPRWADPAQGYRMVGIPDGMGAYPVGDEYVHLFLNHELNKDVVSRPVVGGPAVNGSFVSQYLLSRRDGSVITGDLAYTLIFNGANPVPVGNVYTGAFGRFCSAHLAGPEVGFDRYIYLAGEEASGSATFDGRGGQSVAIVGGAAYLLPHFGRFPWENQVVVPGTGALTVVMGLEDGPSTPDSQLYMYVGVKDYTSDHPMIRNGLVGGRLYVFAAPGDEGGYHKGDKPVTGRWVEVDPFLDDAALNVAAKKAGSFNFVRIEDGTADRNQDGVFYFVTTGSSYRDPSGAYANKLGRLYQLYFDPSDPVGNPAYLYLMLEGDQGDPIINPDNVDINALGQLLIQEDPNAEHRGTYMDPTGSNPPLRDSSVWLFDVTTWELRRITEIDQGAVPDKPGYRDVAGFWETSGVIDAAEIWGYGMWFLNVQAHSLDGLEASQLQGYSQDLGLVEGGQLLIMYAPGRFGGGAADGAAAPAHSASVVAALLAGSTVQNTGARALAAPTLRSWRVNQPVTQGALASLHLRDVATAALPVGQESIRAEGRRLVDSSWLLEFVEQVVDA